MKVGGACVRALLQRKCCVRHRLAQVLFFATSVPAGTYYYSKSRDQVDTDQRREYISINGKAAFSSLQTRDQRGGL